MSARLREEAASFRAWAEGQDHRNAEWETGYPHFERLYAAAREVLAQDCLTDGEVDLLLYALARDNESEVILGDVVAHPWSCLRIAEGALDGRAETDARWQIADALGKLPDERARTLLRGFLQDPDEYVRRRALLASVAFDPQGAEATAVAWLTEPHEYTRLAALSVLEDLRSSRLSDAVAMLRDDSCDSVRERVQRIGASSTRT